MEKRIILQDDEGSWMHYDASLVMFYISTLLLGVPFHQGLSDVLVFYVPSPFHVFWTHLCVLYLAYPFLHGAAISNIYNIVYKNMLFSRAQMFKRWITLSTGKISIQGITQLISLTLIRWIALALSNIWTTAARPFQPSKAGWLPFKCFIWIYLESGDVPLPLCCITVYLETNYPIQVTFCATFTLYKVLIR